MRFIGTTEAKVDNKGRVFLPAMFRKVLLSGSPQTEDCRVLYTEETWERRMNELTSRLSVWSKRDQALKRRFSADAEWLTLDSNGRILLSKRYLKMACIEDEVTFIGMDDTIEVWATAKLREHQSSEDFASEIERVMTSTIDN